MRHLGAGRSGITLASLLMEEEWVELVVQAAVELEQLALERWGPPQVAPRSEGLGRE